MRSMVLAVLAAPLVAAPAIAADRCAGTTPDAESWVAQMLDKAKAVRLSGDPDEAKEILDYTALAIPRTADVSLPARCMGRQNWQRYYREKQITHGELGRRAEISDKENFFLRSILLFIDGDNRSDVDRMRKDLADNPQRYANVGYAVRGKLSDYQRALEDGFTLLPEERSGREFFRAQLDLLIEHSRSRSNALLESESETINGAIREDEAMVESIEADLSQFVGAIVDDESLLPVNESRRDVERAKQSLEQLREAREWLKWISVEELAPVLSRAVERGDVILARANDATVGVEARDDYFASAIRYYNFADSDANQARAESSREALQPALDAERSARRAKMDEKASRMEESARNFQQSMEKSDAEKSSFKSEADALEDELDF